MGIRPYSWGQFGRVPDPPEYPEPTEAELIHDTLMDFYLTNHTFNIFVNKGCQTYNRTLDEMFQDQIVWEYYLSLQKGACNEERDNGSENPEGTSAAGASSACQA